MWKSFLGPNRRVFRVIFAVALLLALSAPAFGQEDIAKHPKCPFCGMDRQQWNFSRVYIEYDDGSSEGTCSLHCAAVSLAVNLDRSPKAIWVGEYNAKTLVSAETAFWVIGGSKAGVMSSRAKWAFATSEAAESFMKANGGTMASFEEAIKGAYEDMYADTKMIRERRAGKRKAAEAEKKAETAAAAKP